MENQDTLNNYAVSVYDAKVIVNDIIIEIAFDLMKKGIAEIYGVPEAAIVGDDRTARFVDARFALYYAVSRFSDRNTAGYLIGRDQTTIARGITKFWQDIDFEYIEAMRAKYFIDKFCDKLFNDEKFIEQNFIFYQTQKTGKLIVTCVPESDTPRAKVIAEALSVATLLEHYKPVYKRKLSQK